MRLHAVLWTPLCLPLVLAIPQDPGGREGRREARQEEPAPEDLYPDEEREHVTRFYSLHGDLEQEALLEALEELDPEASLLEGPVADRGRPGQIFVAVETSAATDPKRLERALKKGRVKVQPLDWLYLHWAPTAAPAGSGGRTGGGRTGGGAGGGNQSLRAQVLGLSGDIHWFEDKGEYLTFYTVPGKVEGADMIKRFAKLYAGSDIPVEELALEVVRDSFEWTVSAECTKSTAKKVAKAIGKLDGVVLVELEPGSGALRVHLELDGLCESGPPGAVAGEGQGSGLRPCFDTNPVYALLLEQELRQLDPAVSTDSR